MIRPVTVPFLLLALTACVTHRDQLYVGSSDYVLAVRDGPGGARDTFRLEVHGSAGTAELQVESEYDKQRPFLGFQLVELDRRMAEPRGLKPYSGLLVQGTYPRSAAQRAGVAPGDVLVGLGGRETIYLAQVADLEAGLREGQEVAAQIRRDGAQLELTLVTQVLDERVTNTERVALEAVASRKAYAGVTLRGIPAVWCERIWGERRNAVVVAAVEVGSPAWLAGLRGGDVIDAVDGLPVPPLASLARSIASRGEVGQSMRFLVSRGSSESYEAVVDLEDYSGETNIWIPLVFDLESGVHQDRWSFGPFGLVMSNRNSYVPDASTRAVETRNVFSAVLGLFRVETSPDETDVRLLWIIHFDT